MTLESLILQHFAAHSNALYFSFLRFLHTVRIKMMTPKTLYTSASKSASGAFAAAVIATDGASELVASLTGARYFMLSLDVGNRFLLTITNSYFRKLARV